MPFITNIYLVNSSLLEKYARSQFTYNKPNTDPDMAFCSFLRDQDVFMYVTNIYDFGHLVNPESFDVTIAEPEMYQIFDNEQDWEARFIHDEYPEIFNPDHKDQQVMFTLIFSVISYIVSKTFVPFSCTF